jgi:hypothetical protein
MQKEFTMSYSTAKTLSAELEVMFVEFDAQVLEKSIDYYKNLVIKLQEAKKEFASLCRDAWSYYPKIYEAVGGKGNYQLIQYGFSDRVAEIITKSEKTKCDKRNIRIAKKLDAIGITKLVSGQVNYSANGFNGVYDVETDKGTKKIIIETIFACGEIQCPHFRVLVKVK